MFLVVVGIDFGTTHSGFAYSHTINPEITTNQTWPSDSIHYGALNKFKISTALLYDENHEVKSWGNNALVGKKTKGLKPVELFKLHLGKINIENSKSRLDGISEPNNFDYKKAIVDYLYQFGKIIKEVVEMRWTSLNFMENVLIVLTVPAVYTDKEKFIMRECAFKAKLINDLYSENLQFTTESEAAAIYCRKELQDFKVPVGKSVLIVDYGGIILNLTVHRLLDNDNFVLAEKTERNFCGAIFVGQEFAKFIGEKVGHDAIKSLKENYYSQYQYMIREFFHCVRNQFDGNEDQFDPIEFDLQTCCPKLIDYTDGVQKERLLQDEYIITLEFHHMKSFFDPAINKIIKLIKNQLDNIGDECSAMFLVGGGFSESKYLQNAIKKEFHGQVGNIFVPRHPMLAVVKGAVEYGLMKCSQSK